MAENAQTENTSAESAENTRIPVTVVRGLPEGKDADLITEAVSTALSTVASEASAASSGSYSDPREALRRHPRGRWGVPGSESRWQTVFNPAGFRG